MKQFLSLIVLCCLVGCQKGSTSESQSANSDSGGASSAAKVDPSIEELLGRLVAGDSGSSATYRMRGDVLVVKILDEWDMNSSFRLGIFNKNGDQWQSMFKNETVPGILDTLIDLNADDTYEMVVSDLQNQSAGSITTTMLYVRLEGQPYEVIDTLGITRAGFDAYSDHPITQWTFEQLEGGVNLRVRNELIPGMDPTVTGDQKYFSTVVERIWVWNGAKLDVTLPTDYLTINGENIWVRDAPTTGKVVMKLNSGDRCKILEKGMGERIKHNSDNWYKIEFKGNIGWVFGSQTSVARHPKI